MKNILQKKIIEALKDQKEIFGDELFEKYSARKTKIEAAAGKTRSVKNAAIADSPETVNISEPKAKEKSFFEDAREDWEKASDIENLNRLICHCTKCRLGSTRNKFVFGSGNPDADVMVVGEGPGADEDAQGLPFVGRAGKLLTDILKAIKFERDEVYIANVVKCRPPGNRTPYPQEMETCMPYLRKQIELIKPKLILCLGLTAAQGLLKRKESLTKMRGKLFELDYSSEYGMNGLKPVKVMVTYHPAALLRNPGWKRGCWEDVQKFRKLYDESFNRQ